MTGEAFGLGRWTPSPFAAQARSSCNECGAPVRWFRSRDLVARVAPDQRMDAQELLAFVGPDADAWHCSMCRNYGSFEADMNLF